MAGHLGSGAHVANYRIYCLDAGGKIGLAEWFEADSEEEAIQKALELNPRAHKCELWQRTRLVARLNSPGELEMVGE
jgi:hypothetical protein